MFAVADAYDAMTSARAYRPGRLPHEAIAELRRGAGYDFDALSVQALVKALPQLPALQASVVPIAFQFPAPSRRVCLGAWFHRQRRLTSVSSGQRPRLSLAVQSVTSQVADVPTLIFDEIDQGIGGRVGLIVGFKLWNLSRLHQVFCVTHLPQLASFGDEHYQVQKIIQGNRTLTRVERLDGEKYVSPYHLALAHAGVGNLDAAFASLDQAWLDRDPALSNVHVDPRFEPLRADALLAAAGVHVVQHFTDGATEPAHAQLEPAPARARAPSRARPAARSR